MLCRGARQRSSRWYCRRQQLRSHGTLRSADPTLEYFLLHKENGSSVFERTTAALLDAVREKGSYEELYNLDKRIKSRLSFEFSVASRLVSDRELVLCCVPHHSWRPWKFFSGAPKWFWHDVAHLTQQGDIVGETVSRLWLMEDVLNCTSEQTMAECIDAAVANQANFSTTTRTRLQLLGGDLTTVINRLLLCSESKEKETQPANNTSIVKLQIQDWNLPVARRKYLDSLKNQAGADGYTEMYSLRFIDVLKSGGQQSLFLYNGSLALAIMTEYPEHSWRCWQFPVSPRTWWTHFASGIIAGDPVAIAAVSVFLEDVAKQHDVQTLDDWVRVSRRDVRRQTQKWRYIDWLGGLPFLLRKVYPNHEWSFPRWSSQQRRVLNQSLPLKIKQRLHENAAVYPDSYWNNLQNVTEFLSTLKDQLGGKYEDLYRVTKLHIMGAGGVGLLKKNQSVATIIMTVFPNFHWKPWKFVQPPPDWWKELALGFRADRPEAIEIVSEFVRDLEEQFGITSPEDWNQVGAREYGKATWHLLQNFGGLSTVLSKVYTDMSLEPYQGGHYSKIQASLKRSLHALLPNEITE